MMVLLIVYHVIFGPSLGLLPREAVPTPPPVEVPTSGRPTVTRPHFNVEGPEALGASGNT